MPTIDKQPVSERAVAAGEPMATGGSLNIPMDYMERPYRELAPGEKVDPSHLSANGEVPVAIYGSSFTQPRVIDSGEAIPVLIAQTDQTPKSRIGRREAQKSTTVKGSEPRIKHGKPKVINSISASDMELVPVLVDLMPDGTEVVIAEKPAIELKPVEHKPPFSRRCAGGRVTGPGSKAGGASKPERKRRATR